MHLGWKKTHGFVVYSVTHRLRPSPKKSKQKKATKSLFELWRSLARAVTHAVTHLSCDGAELSDQLFGPNKPFLVCFFQKNDLCICVFCGEYGCICMISICVADNQL